MQRAKSIAYTHGAVLLFVALGGAAGTLGRFALSGWVVTWAFTGFPWGTFAVNVTGSLLLGFLYRALSPTSIRARAFLGTGLCGGFTTFSTFDFETLALLQQGEIFTAIAYSLGSVAACLIGIYGGFVMASTLASWRSRGEVRADRI